MAAHRSGTNPYLQSNEFAEEGVRDSQISLSRFPMPPKSKLLTTPPDTPFHEKLRFAGAFDKSADSSGVKNRSVGVKSGKKDTTAFTSASLPKDEDVFQGHQNFDIDSDFATVPHSRRTSLAIIDSPPYTPCTGTTGTTVNSLDLHSPTLNMGRAHKVHHEHLHPRTPYSPASGNLPIPSFPVHHSRSRNQSRELDFDITIPSPDLHLKGQAYFNSAKVSPTAHATAAAVTTPSAGYGPPSPMLPPLPAVPYIAGYANPTTRFGSASANAYVHSPGQARVPAARRPEIHKATSYGNVASRISPRTHDVWKDNRDEEDQLLPAPSIQAKSPRPPIPSKSPKRASITGKTRPAANPSETYMPLDQIGASSPYETKASRRYEASAMKTPNLPHSKSSPQGFEQGFDSSSLADIVAQLRGLIQEDEEETDHSSATVPKLEHTKPKLPPQHEDIGVAFTSTPGTNDIGTEAANLDIVFLASTLLTSPVKSGLPVLGEDSEAALATMKPSQGWIATLRQRADSLAEKKKRFDTAVAHMKQTVPPFPGIDAETQMARLHRLLRESKLQETKAMAEKAEIDLLLTECVIELMKIRTKLGLGEKGHAGSNCPNCQAAEEFEKKKAEWRKAKIDETVSEEGDGGVLGLMNEAIDHEQMKEMHEQSIATAFHSPREQNKILVKNSELGEIMEQPGEMTLPTETGNNRFHYIPRPVPARSRVREAAAYSAIIETSPFTSEASTSEGKNISGFSPSAQNEEYSTEDDRAWMSRGIHGNENPANTIRRKAATLHGPSPSLPTASLMKKIAENEQVRRVDRGMYQFLQQPPSRSVSPEPLLADRQPKLSIPSLRSKQPIPSLRKGRPLPQQLTRIRTAHEVDDLDLATPRIADKKDIPPMKFNFKSMMQKTRFGGAKKVDAIGGDAAETGLKRENDVVPGPSKEKDTSPQKKSKVTVNEVEDTGENAEGSKTNIVKKMAEAMEGKSTSEELGRTTPLFKSFNGPKSRKGFVKM
ncbi:MAG: hypothetical protein M1821_007337 [Bathelium mastoideum]|nr:MAG: hypothetical protein M1821_007337 [Bathelium mastoideum]